MNPNEIVSAAALAYGAYVKLRRAARAQGMTSKAFQAAVAAECERIDKWVADSNAAEDAVFRAKNHRDG